MKGRLLQHLLRSKNDPSYFNDVILQRGPMWSAEKEWSEAVVAYRQVCIESGNMTGKGWWIAGLILWNCGLARNPWSMSLARAKPVWERSSGKR